MKMTELFLAELEREAVLTRRALEQVPDGKGDWKPHEKSMPFGRLATLVATMPGWVTMMIDQDELDIKPVGGSTFQQEILTSSGKLVEAHEASVAQGRAALKKTTDEHLMTPWKFLVGGQVMSQNPRHIMLRDGVFNHLAHHRGQLTVYLRLNDAMVPTIYGPTADDPRAV